MLVWSRRRIGAKKRRHRFARTRHLKQQAKPTAAAQRSYVDRMAQAERAEAIERFRRAKEGLPQPEISQGYLRRPGMNPRKALMVHAPSVLSIREARDEFLGLIYEFRWIANVQLPPGARTFQPIVIDLVRTDEITLDAALVLTSEYHAACLAADRDYNFKPLIDDKDWQPQVRSLLKTLGFYELVKPVDTTAEFEPPAEGELRFVQFVSDELVNGIWAEQLLDALRDAAGAAPKRELAYGALLEAIGNVRGHAYPKDSPPDVIERVPNWWAAGAYDPKRGVLEFAVYDRGVGIPSTLPKQDFFASILRLTSPERTDADVIAGAIRYGRTRHSLSRRKGGHAPLGRGNGLWSICKIVEELEGSFVRISSERGEVEYHGRRDVRKKDHANPFTGTLVEWTLKLPPDLATPPAEQCTQ